jgi:hypothetical protein
MLLALSAQLESLFFVWQVMIRLGCQLLIFELVYLLGRR